GGFKAVTSRPAIRTTNSHVHSCRWPTRTATLGGFSITASETWRFGTLISSLGSAIASPHVHGVAWIHQYRHGPVRRSAVFPALAPCIFGKHAGLGEAGSASLFGMFVSASGYRDSSYINCHCDYLRCAMLHLAMARNER